MRDLGLPGFWYLWGFLQSNPWGYPDLKRYTRILVKGVRKGRKRPLSSPFDFSHF